MTGRVVIPVLQVRGLKLGKPLLGLERRELGIDFSDLNVSAFYPDSCGFKTTTVTTKHLQVPYSWPSESLVLRAD